jgi:hypothetical protein
MLYANEGGIFTAEKIGWIVRRNRMSTMTIQQSKLRFFFPMIFDLFAPIFVYYVLHLAGLNDFIALTAGGFISGINAVVDTLRNRQARSISILVFILFVISIVLVFATQDPRIILLKPSIFIGAAGIYTLTTAFRRPLLLDGMEPFATQGDPARRERWKRIWQEAGPFRRKMQMATLLTGLLLLCEAAARVIIVLRLPVRLSVIASNIPGLLLIVFFALIGRFYLKPAAEQFMEGQGK